MFRPFASILALLLLAAGSAAPAQQSRGDQESARKAMQAGNLLSLREIEKRILPQMQGMQYLGPEYDPVAMAYRLKFIKDGHVVFVDVDARTGRIISRSQ